ncbi:MAG: hypothetical protein J5449_01710 [Oscillospiraceae bacterium]|nr:hypothetical protein [Oscillospiraceae bacterium]
MGQLSAASVQTLTHSVGNGALCALLRSGEREPFAMKLPARPIQTGSELAAEAADGTDTGAAEGLDGLSPLGAGTALNI